MHFFLSRQLSFKMRNNPFYEKKHHYKMFFKTTHSTNVSFHPRHPPHKIIFNSAAIKFKSNNIILQNPKIFTVKKYGTPMMKFKVLH